MDALGPESSQPPQAVMVAGGSCRYVGELYQWRDDDRGRMGLVRYWPVPGFFHVEWLPADQIEMSGDIDDHCP